jgi:hyaluronoglucosaminidase
LRGLGFGVVEGFYGPAWSHAARLSMVRFLAREGLATYVRAPKNDPDGLARPSRALGTRASAELEELFDLGDATGVRIGCAIAPDRVRELAKLGGRLFVVSFDDTWATFVRPAATFERGRRHGQAAQGAWRAARDAGADADVLLVPAVYHRRTSELSTSGLAYLRGIASVAPDIPVAWTGPNVFSRSIAPGDGRALREATGLRVWIWNNAIANDWLPLVSGEAFGLRPWQKLSFGPVENLALGVAEETLGVLVNGAREPELTKISLACLASYARAPLDWDPVRAHAAAIERVAGPDRADLLRDVYAWTRAHPLAAPARFEARELDDVVAAYRAGRASRAEMIEALRRVIDVRARARSLADRTGPLAEALPSIERAALVAEAAIVALERSALRRGERARSDEHGSVNAWLAPLRALRSRSRRVDVERLDRKLSALLSEAAAIRWQVGLDPLWSLIDAERSA